MNHEPQPSNHRDGLRNFVGLFVLVCRAMAVPAELILRRWDSFGERYLGAQTGLAIALIGFWPAFCSPKHSSEPVYLFLILFVCSCAIVRFKTARRVQRGGPQPHTFYSGTPLLMRYLSARETTIKGQIEPVVLVLAGTAVGAFSPPLGGYLMLAGLALFISTQLSIGYERQRAMDMNDAYIDQRNVADRFREVRRD